MLDDYVQKGLMLHYDAVKNTKNGHDTNATTWYDLSGNGNNGTLNGEMKWTEDGLYFDGINDWVGIGQMDYENITIEAVIMYSNVNIEREETDIVANWQNGGYGLRTYNNFNAFTVFTNEWKDACGKDSLQTNFKYSLSGRYNQTDLVLYENGYKTSTKLEGQIKRTVGNTIMVLGSNPTGDNAYDAYLNGTIYSVRIYNRALTDDEVMQNYKIDKMLYGVEDIN